LNIYIISPVRNITKKEENYIKNYVEHLEKLGNKVYFPLRDTDQNDPIGFKICQQNMKAIEVCDRVDVFWNDKSRGSLFDLGIAFVFKKPIKIINTENIRKTPYKSFINVLLKIQKDGYD